MTSPTPAARPAEAPASPGRRPEWTALAVATLAVVAAFTAEE